MLPRSIGKLEQLKYLNLSATNIREIPQRITKLHILESINLSYCLNLEKLRDNIYQLVSLGHLDLSFINSMQRVPGMIGRLSCLRTLPAFYVSRNKEDGRSDIGELGTLNLLRGVLAIMKLDNVRGWGEACAAKLEEKCFLRRLLLVMDHREN